MKRLSGNVGDEKAGANYWRTRFELRAPASVSGASFSFFFEGGVPQKQEQNGVILAPVSSARAI